MGSHMHPRNDTPTTPAFLTQQLLAERWHRHPITIRRMQRAGLLHPTYPGNSRRPLYPLAEVERLEADGQA
jgi:hypothetical protein